MTATRSFLRVSRVAYLWALISAAWLYYAVGHAVLTLIAVGGVPLAHAPAVFWATTTDIAEPPLIGLLIAAPLACLEWAARRQWRTLARRTD